MYGHHWYYEHMNKHLKAAENLSAFMDNQFSLFGIRFGIDPLIGLIPGIGDVISALFSCYLIWIAYKLHAPPQLLGRMLKNVAIDFIIGSLPIVGDIGDILFKANKRNLVLLQNFTKHTTIIDAEMIAEG